MRRFKDIITHQRHLQYLQTAVEEETMPHALLFWGPEGTGALAAALAISTYMVCEDRQQDGPCGKCRGCVKSDKFMHPDVHFAFPTIGSKVTGNQLYPQWREALTENSHMNRQQWLERIDAEGKQGNINVEDCQRIVNLLMLHRFEANCKILIVWLPEYLGKEGNRLLKIIEEPPADSFIFLVAENREEILPTILSRCQQFYFPLLTSDTVEKGLSNQLGIEQERAGWIALSAQGDWNLALQLANGTTFNPVQWTQDWIKAAWSRDPSLVASWSDAAAKYSREESKQRLQFILGVLEKVLWLKFGKDFLINPEEKKTLEFLNTKIEHRELIALTTLCEENLQAVQQNISGRMMWFHLTLALQRVLTAENAQVELT